MVKEEPHIIRADHLPQQKEKTILPQGVKGMGFAGDAYGQPITNYYFEHAVDALVEATVQETKGQYAPQLRKVLEKNRGRVMHIAVTPEGKKELLSKLNFDQLRNDFLKPELFNAVKISEGSEGVVWKYLIDGRPIAVKLFSEEKDLIARDNPVSRIKRTVYPKSDFTPHLGLAKRIVAELEDFPKHHYDLSTLIEYAASKNYIAMEMGPSLTFRDLLHASGIDTKFDITKDGEENAKKFLADHSISEDNLKLLRDELIHLREVAELLQYTKSGFLGTLQNIMPDLTEGNFLVRGFDVSRKTFDLILIDQGQGIPFWIMHPAHADSLAAGGARGSYDALFAVPEMRAYLMRHNIEKPAAI